MKDKLTKRQKRELQILAFLFSIWGILLVSGWYRHRSINTAIDFPDPNFRHAVEAFLNLQPGESFDAESALGVYGFLRCNGKKIKDLTGIEYLPNIIGLDCSSNELTTLDVSKNRNLYDLICTNNRIVQLRGIELSANLKNLDCASNEIKILDVSKNTILNHLVCSNNRLTELDVSLLPLLKHLDCSSNQLSNVDLIQNDKLVHVNFSNNRLTRFPDLSPRIPGFALFNISKNQLDINDKNTNQILRGMQKNCCPIDRLPTTNQKTDGMNRVI